MTLLYQLAHEVGLYTFDPAFDSSVNPCGPGLVDRNPTDGADFLGRGFVAYFPETEPDKLLPLRRNLKNAGWDGGGVLCVNRL